MTMTPDTAVKGESEDPGLSHAVLSLWQDFLRLLQDHFQLAALETRRAGECLAVMVVAGVMIAILLSGAWLGLMAMAVLMLMAQGMEAYKAILVAVAGNLLAALLGCGVIRHKSRALSFPATRRCIETTTDRELA